MHRQNYLRRSLAALVLTLTALPGWGAQVLALSKTSYERFNISVDFSQVVPAADFAVGSVTAAIGLTDTTAAVIAASPAPAVVSGTSSIVFQVIGGTPGSIYTIAVRANNTLTGERFEGDVQLTILR